MSFLQRGAVLTGLLALCAPAAAQDAAPSARATAFRQGTHAFRRTLYDLVGQPLEVLTEVTQLNDAPEKTLLVVLGETDILDRIPGQLHSFVLSGGAALVATDRELDAHRLSRNFNVMCSGHAVRITRGTDQTWYREQSECPYVVAMGDAGPPLFRGLARVATNRPSFLQRPGGFDFGGLPFLAALAPGSRLAGLPVGFPSDRLAFAAGGEWGAERRGRVLVLADHSVFINEMLSQTDNDNFEFAFRCLDWLSDSGKRNRVLFVEEGETQMKFDVPVKYSAPPLPAPGVIVEIVNRALQGLDEENAFNEMIQNRINATDPATQTRMLHSTLFLLTVSLLLYSLVRLASARQRIDPATVPLLTVLARQAPAGAVVEQRQRELVRAGNLYEPARALARQWFEAIVGPGARDGLPHVTATGGWRRRWQVRRQIGRLWRLAYDDRPARVSAKGFAALTTELNTLRAALTNGRIQLTASEP